MLERMTTQPCPQPRARRPRPLTAVLAAGVVAILLSLVLANRHTTTGAGYSSRRVTHTDPATGSRVEETDVDPGR